MTREIEFKNRFAEGIKNFANNPPSPPRQISSAECSLRGEIALLMGAAIQAGVQETFVFDRLASIQGFLETMAGQK